MVKGLEKFKEYFLGFEDNCDYAGIWIVFSIFVRNSVNNKQEMNNIDNITTQEIQQQLILKEVLQQSLDEFTGF